MLALTWAGGVSADPSRRVALVIANAGYGAANYLPNPPRDAALVQAALTKAGFETVQVSNDLRHEAFFSALHEFSARARGAEVAFIYYAGHAIQSDGRNWLIPVDANLAEESDLNLEAVDLDTVLSAVDGAKWRIVALDACRENPFSPRWRGRTRGYALPGLSKLEADNVLVLYAAAPNKSALDGRAGQDSPFAVALAQSLARPGLEIQRLGNQVRDDVIAATDAKQQPFVSGSISNESFYFIPPPAPPRDPLAVELALWKRAYDSGDIGQFNIYLQQYPDGNFVGVARDRIAALERRDQSAKPAEASAPPTSSPGPEQPNPGTVNQQLPKSDAPVASHEPLAKIARIDVSPTPRRPPPRPQPLRGPGSAQDFVTNVGDAIFFDSAAVAVRTEAAVTLDRQAAWLRRHSAVRVRVEGNSDDSGDEDGDIALGLRRAQAVRDYLVGRGLSPDRIEEVVSYGHGRPVIPGDSAEARAQNRSVRTVIVEELQ
ncbi:MAG TPA: caspase family protein [Caulobacteraceae bacterium]|nr:caspase family protein [Caulobacteraceae bacterium]